MLPELERNKTYRQIDHDFTQGLWHRYGHKQGTYFAGENVCGDLYPALCSRPPRRIWQQLSEGVQGMCCADDLYIVCNGELLRAVEQNNLEVLGSVNMQPKLFGSLGNSLLILPDFKVYDTRAQTLRSARVSLLLSGVTVRNQDYVDTDGVARAIQFNTLHCQDYNFLDYFSPGDSIRINGSDYNDGYYTIRSVEEYDLRFDENAFAPESMTSCTMSKDAPALKGICACGGRLWGFAGHTIYASAPEQVDNWYRYDNDSQSSARISVPGNGDFTACVMHAGHPVFFKANSMVEVYGESPADFAVVETVLSGVMPGSAASLCSVGGDLLYLSENGVIRCSGSTATVISEALGEKLSLGIATTDGRRYYLSAKNASGKRALYVYDTVTRAWHCEDGEGICYMGYLSGDVYAYCADNTVYILGQDNTGHGFTQGTVDSCAEFHSLTDDARGEMVPVRLGVRVYCEQGSELCLSVRYDGGEWEHRAQLSCTGARLWQVPLMPRTCHTLGIRITGKGAYRILSLIKEYK